jgi:hypothetical protein
LMNDLKSMKIGRDKLFDILELIIYWYNQKRRYVTTNLIIDLENIKPNSWFRNK